MRGTVFDLDKQLAKEEYGKWPGRCRPVGEFAVHAPIARAGSRQHACLTALVRDSATCRDHDEQGPPVGDPCQVH